MVFYEIYKVVSSVTYTLSFTTGAALIYESVIVADLYVELQNWLKVRAKLMAENSFQSRTESTLKKLYGEISRRLKHLTDDQLNLLAMGTDEQKKALVWLAICRQYQFIHDFTIEVLIPQYEAAHFLLTYEDYDAFFNAKAEWHDNLDSASRQTKSKARQVIFKMLKECGLINDGNELIYQKLDEHLFQVIGKASDDLRLYPGNS
ncbi:DUF1819 family protein [Acinetobacter sp. YH12085]|uniref:DUF1819 family protein n=1 Tax=Acinetobacter sp. YH12085 TaxID=2601077 RepID=UPI0035A08BB0